jgi:hypothetical protein
VVIGEPVRFTTDDCERAGRGAYQQISDRVMERIAALRNEPDASSSVP